MPHTNEERYAVVSCHVERPLDDAVWGRFARLQAERPGGFEIAALMRPPDASEAGAAALWLERARAAAERGPVGHHTHWTSPSHARPSGGEPAERVLAEGEWLRESGVAATLFCGGGWYTDRGVAEACAALGYVDCTPRATRPGYLPADAPWAHAAAPARIRLPGGSMLLTVPTTHSVGALARELVSRRGPALPLVHVYFHDTDLADRRRALLVRGVLAGLGARRTASGLDALAAAYEDVPVRAWAEIARPAGSSRDWA